VGLLLAVWTLSALYPIVLSTVPLPDGLASSFSLNLTPDWRVFLFTLLLASVAGIGAGLIPALQVSKPNLGPALKNEGSTVGQQFSQSRLRSVFVVLQVAVCMALLAAAGLLARNLQRVKTIDTGMSTTNVFSVAVGLSAAEADKTGARAGELRRQLADRLRATPGVLAVAEAHQQPLSGGMGNTGVTMPGQSAEHPFEARFNFVSPEYFEALNISLTRGRHFTAQDVASHAPLIVISDATAQRYWPGVDPLGRHLGVAVSEQSSDPRDQDKQANFRQYEVIGVARDARSRWVWEKDETLLYLPLSPNSSKGQFLLVHTQADPGGVMRSVRDLATSIDPALRTASRRISDDISFQMAPFRVVAWLSGTLGLLALLLASIGLYGVMSFVVTQRTREIGIRVALGAQPKAVVRMFVVQGLRLTLMGIVGGVIGGLLISRLLTSVLIDLSPFDLVAFSSVAAFLTSVALLAIFIPARRAAKVDPLIALRYE
jgi:predicted permease